LLKSQFDQAHAETQAQLNRWVAARHSGDEQAERDAHALAAAANERTSAILTKTHDAIAAAHHGAAANDADYVFITFVTEQLPHGLIGLLIAAFCAATLSSKSAELNALGATTTVDIYRRLFKPAASDAHYVRASRWFTALWGVVALGFALFAQLAENLIQAVNIVGSVFYGVVLGMFLAAFGMPWVRGTAVFWAAIVSQALVFVLYANLSISYLWYNLIGCVACLALSAVLQLALDVGRDRQAEELVAP
jgi:Na+/proline symporter